MYSTQDYAFLILFNVSYKKIERMTHNDERKRSWRSWEEENILVYATIHAVQADEIFVLQCVILEVTRFLHATQRSVTFSY
jgi:adenosyl cobinamide kinase/adenosyl cobinamide phosphate guanylyltransferase